mgnify:CR=1 FL=1
MNWLRKLPGSQRSASGLEWVIWRKLPMIFLAGTALPLLGLALLHWLSDAANAAAQHLLQIIDYILLCVLVFHCTAVVMLRIAGVTVIVMKV